MNMVAKTLSLVSGLALALLGVSVAVPIGVNVARGQYPGAVTVGGEGLALNLRGPSALHWQTTYVTTDALLTVKAWYAARFGIAQASEMNLSVVDGCAWLTETRSIVVATHEASVLACTVPSGTRITVSESIRLGP